MQLLRLLGPKADVVRSLIKRYDDKAKEIEFLNQRRNNNPAQEHKMVDSKDLVNDTSLQHEIVLFLGDIQGRKAKGMNRSSFNQTFLET